MIGGAERGLLAATLAACLAACGGATAVRVAAAHPGSSVQSNRVAAQREADRLLTLTDVPPGSDSLHSPPAQLDGPATGTPSVQSLVDKARYWSVPMSFDQTKSWFEAHPPRGNLSKEGSSSGGGPDFQSGGVSYSAGKSAAWESAELEISYITSKDPNRTFARVDAVVVWLDPKPTRDDASGRRLHFTVAQGCPANDRGAVGATNDGRDLDQQLLPSGSPSAALTCTYAGLNGREFALTGHRLLDANAAAAAAQRLRALPLSHVEGGVSSCPADTGGAGYVTFDYPGGRSVTVAVGLSGCARVGNGHISTGAGDAAVGLFGRS